MASKKAGGRALAETLCLNTTLTSLNLWGGMGREGGWGGGRREEGVKGVGVG